jgi:hypothetical protein
MADGLDDGFDVIVDGVGFVAAWDWATQNGYQSALLDITEPGDVPIGSTPAAESAPMLVRERSDWYVWSVANWQEGAGQRTHDDALASDTRFFISENVDIERQGELRLTRAVHTLANPTQRTATGVLCNGLGTVWAVFRSGEHDQVAYWDGDAWVFPTGQPPLGGTISSLTCDGAYVYAAWPDSGIMKMKRLRAMTEALIPRVVSMCISSGMLCIAREGVRDEENIPNGASAGYLNYADPRAYVPCTPTLGTEPAFITMPDMGIVGLAPERNWVYLATVNGQNSHVYRFQPLTGDFEDAAGFADGFVATCVTAAAGMVIIGGYYHPGIDAEGNEIEDTGIGAIYTLIPGSGVELLTDIGDDPNGDTRVLSVAPHGKRLAIISGGNLLHWDLVRGGWHQRCAI